MKYLLGFGIPLLFLGIFACIVLSGHPGHWEIEE